MSQLSTLYDIPEVAALDAGSGLVRIPPNLDVPLSARVRRLIDTAEMRRLAKITQLGLVTLVYPAANHSRLEHSLGVYRLALLWLKRLAFEPRFRNTVTPADAERFLVAALLHDLGHWAFCHPIEDLRLQHVPTHELFANSFLLESELADHLRNDWAIQPRDIVTLLSGKPEDNATRILQSMLSGPVDIDKMDYLMRDSLHAGVPYGRNFDQSRLIRSLCLDEPGLGIAITEKGKTAAEMMVFARYVMFSEVYWHHAVRTATAMLARAFYLLSGKLNMDPLFRLSEEDMVRKLKQLAGKGPAAELLDGIFGSTRCLYKRLAQYSLFEDRPLYERLARRPYPWLVACAEQLATLASTALSRVVAPHEILLDAPPAKREVEFNIPVFYAKEACYRPLGEVSPVVRTLAQQQFDDYVKRVRIFVHPRLAEDMNRLSKFSELVAEAIDRTE